MSEIHTETERLRQVEDAIIRLSTELPHLATREMISELRVSIGRIETQLPHFATKDELGKTEIRLVKWMIGTGIVAVTVLSVQLWAAVQVLLRVLGAPH